MDDRRLPLPPVNDVEDRLIWGLSSFRGAAGDELEGASRIHPHPTGWRVAPTVDLANKRYEDASECDFCKYASNECVWPRVVSRNACNVDKSVLSVTRSRSIVIKGCTLETTGTPNGDINNQFSPFLLPTT